MGTTYMDFGTGVFRVDGDAPLTQAQVDSVWRHLPTTGASWVERGDLFVQQFDGAQAFNLGPVEHGVKGASDKVRFGGHTKRHHATKKSPAQLQREIDEALAKPATARTYEIAFKKKGSGRLKWVAVEADNITDASMKARALMATRYPGKGYVEYGHSRDPNVPTVPT